MVLPPCRLGARINLLRKVSKCCIKGYGGTINSTPSNEKKNVNLKIYFPDDFERYVNILNPLTEVV